MEHVVNKKKKNTFTSHYFTLLHITLPKVLFSVGFSRSEMLLEQAYNIG